MDIGNLIYDIGVIFLVTYAIGMSILLLLVVLFKLFKLIKMFYSFLEQKRIQYIENHMKELAEFEQIKDLTKD